MENTRNVRRREYLKLTGAGATVSTLGLAGCLGGGEGEDDESGDGSDDDDDATGTLTTQVTDQPGDIADFESCVVTIQGIWLKAVDDESEETDETDGEEEEDTEDEDAEDQEQEQEQEQDQEREDETETNETDDEEPEDLDEEDVDTSESREYHEFDEPQTADLVSLQGENTQLVDERELPAREYEYLQLDVTDVEGTLEGGDDATVSTPGNAPLQFKERFEIREDEVTTFVADFTPVRRGRTNEYLIQPVARGTKVLYGDEEYELDEEDDDGSSDEASGDEDETNETAE